MEIAQAAEPILLAMVRIVTFIVIAPPFSHRAIPATVKAMVATGLALAMAPGGLVPAADAAQLIGRVVTEAVTGGALGALVLVVFAAVQSAGRLLDVLGGFEMGAAFDPLTMTQGAAFGRLYQLTAVVLLFASDGYQLVVLGMARTFDLVPLGTGLDTGAVAGGLSDAVTQMFLAALQIAGPLLVVLLLADVGLGLLTRVAPALNAFALGFPLKIMLTLVLGAVAVLALPAVVSWLAGDALDLMLGTAT